ncbi:phosphatase PAP2 family protein [bacterium]|nr:phosphatase PAP2 family protein [bacterium]
MIDILSDASWLNPQVDFLVFLQNIRMAHSDIFNKFFLSITIFGEVWLPSLICAIVYWCFSSRNGLYMFSLLSLNVLITHFLKLIAGVYRPWVLSNRVKPIETALRFATSYSFPSGHSAMSSSVLGGLAFILRKYKAAVAAVIILVLMIGFSRLWLGVHTPQDVIVGFSTGLILIFAGHYLINWAEQDKNRYLYILIAVNILTIIGMIYIRYFNQYPMNYIDGKILVNPFSSMRNTVIFYGYALGLINGGMLCRRFFPFDAKNGGVKVRIARGVVGALLLVYLLRGPAQYVLDNPLRWSVSFGLMFLFGITITAIYPLIFTAIEKKFCKE